MAIATDHLSSFYSLRHLAGRADLVAVQDRGRLEDRIRALVARGDSLFTRHRYQLALESYLRAYALAYRWLHPDFPVATAVARPEILLDLDALGAVTRAVADTARFQHLAVAPEVVAPYDPPPTVRRTVETWASGPGASRSLAELRFASALQLLEVGAAEEAGGLLANARRLNRGQDRTLDARITVADAAVREAAGDLQGALQVLTTARDAFNQLGMTATAAIVEADRGVVTARAGDVAAGQQILDGTVFNLPGGVIRGGFSGAAAARLELHADLGGVLGPVGPVLRGDLGRDGLGGRLGRLLPNAEGAAGMAAAGAAGGRALGSAASFLIPLAGGELLEFDRSIGETLEPAGTFRVVTGTGLVEVPLGDGGDRELTDRVLAPRTGQTTLGELNLDLTVRETFLAYVPHVYGFVLPMSIADCYAALGQRSRAVDFYLKALAYPHLNAAIESPAVWLRATRAIVDEADHRFRRDDPEGARPLYEEVVRTNGVVPAGSRLFRSARFNPMTDVVSRVVTAIDGGAAFLGNREVAVLVAHVRAQLAKIEGGLNWLGLDPDLVPIWSFDFLQATARYFAQHAIQAWRQYISYRSAAEQEELTQLELEQAVTLNETALAVQQAREDLADQQVGVAEALQAGAALHRDNLVDQRDDFNAAGWVIAELNRFQAWYGNVDLGGDYDAAHWDWGGGYELSIGEASGQESVDAVIRYRNRLSHQMQIDNFNRQIAEAENQMLVADRQVAVARAQQRVAELETFAATQRLDFARENLAFFSEQEFTPDLWHALADEMGRLARRYLDMGIYAAFLMERAYNAENDRDLRRIRFDYAEPGGVSELTAGDSLLMDVDSFTHDQLVHVKGRRNRVRHVISLADFAPQAFFGFLADGTMEFTVPLWVLERAYPGTYLHRIQSVEIDVEGLAVPEGITGTLRHLGISSWRRGDGTIQSRVTAPESLVLSGFRLRRDAVLYRADPDRLAVFENSGTAGSWRLELPHATNDVDFSTIFDVRLVLYFYCLHDPDLEAQVRAAFPADGQAAQAFSARLHAPDEYFAFGPPPDGAATINFALDPDAFPYNQVNLRSTEIGLQVLRSDGVDPPAPFPGVALTVRTAGRSASGVTGADGVLASAGGGGDLGALVGAAVGDVEVEFTGPPEQRVEVADLHLFLNYRFDYR